jgi:phage terminase large subunit-like protein
MSRFQKFAEQQRRATSFMATQSPMNWASLYQQRPAPADGDYFKAEWLKPYERIPDLKTLRTYAASDYAVTSKGGDYTVHIVVGIDPKNRLYVLDLWRAQTTPDVWVDEMLDMARLWKPIAWAEEVGQIRSSVGPFIEKRMAERKIPLFRRQFPTKHDKSVRAQSIRGRMSLGELLSFPAGKHDDIVDALGLVGQLHIMSPGWCRKSRWPGTTRGKIHIRLSGATRTSACTHAAGWTRMRTRTARTTQILRLCKRRSETMKRALIAALISIACSQASAQNRGFPQPNSNANIGLIGGTLNFTQFTAPVASGVGIVEPTLGDCIPASAQNQAIAVVSAAPGSGGTVSVSAWGFYW